MDDGPLILLVEDDGPIRDTVAECLAAEGYQVERAAHGGEALAWLQAGGRPALVVLDLVMPVMNGAELLVQLRASDTLRGTPVLLMTAAIPSAAAPLPAADAVLVKPFDLDQLLETVQRLVPRG